MSCPAPSPSRPRPATPGQLRAACATAAVAAALSVAGPAWSAPFTPGDDRDVVESLPLRVGAPMREARRQLARQPEQLPLALQVARASLVRARESGDPREYAAVQAALAPWWDQPAPPPAVRLIRASVLQSRHAFDDALRDLHTLLADPQLPPALRAQGLLEQAAVLQVLGRYAEARQSCESLLQAAATLGASASLPARACLAELRSLQGDAAGAAAALAALAREPSAGPWLSLVRAELAMRLGDDAGAGQLLRSALAGQRDTYVQAVWADWLLAAGRAAEAAALWRGTEADRLPDALLLRRAIALHRLGDAAAADDAAQLEARFAATRARGDAPHAREEALFALEVRGDPALALQLALAQWSQQKEPADALLLMRAAHAAGRPQDAEPVRRFVRDTGLVDRRLQAADAAPRR